MAGFAADPDKTARQNAAVEIGFHLFMHVNRKRCLAILARKLQKGQVIFLKNTVKNCRLRAVTEIGLGNSVLRL